MAHEKHERTSQHIAYTDGRFGMAVRRQVIGLAREVNIYAEAQKSVDEGHTNVRVVTETCRWRGQNGKRKCEIDKEEAIGQEG